MNLKKAFGQALKITRSMKGLTQEDFGIVSSRTYVSSLERGQKSPTIDKVQDLAKVLGVHPIALIGLAYAPKNQASAAAELLRGIASELDEIEAKLTVKPG